MGEAAMVLGEEELEKIGNYVKTTWPIGFRRKG